VRHANPEHRNRLGARAGRSLDVWYDAAGGLYAKRADIEALGFVTSAPATIHPETGEGGAGTRTQSGSGRLRRGDGARRRMVGAIRIRHAVPYREGGEQRPRNRRARAWAQPVRIRESWHAARVCTPAGTAYSQRTGRAEVVVGGRRPANVNVKNLLRRPRNELIRCECRHAMGGEQAVSRKGAPGRRRMAPPFDMNHGSTWRGLTHRPAPASLDSWQAARPPRTARTGAPVPGETA
jgi:hypothetical protein